MRNEVEFFREWTQEERDFWRSKFKATESSVDRTLKVLTLWTKTREFILSKQRDGSIVVNVYSTAFNTDNSKPLRRYVMNSKGKKLKDLFF